MPHENCTPDQMKKKGLGCPLRVAECIAPLSIPNPVFVAAVIHVPYVLLQALWERVHHATTLRAGPRNGSRLPAGSGLLH